MQLVDLRPDHLALVHEILRRFVPKAEVSVFGSRAKWLARETSDLDLCIREAEPLGFKRMGLLMEAFEESNLPYKVDVVDWATTSEGFRKIIERDKVVVQKARIGRVSPQGVTRQSAETLSGAVGLRCANPTLYYFSCNEHDGISWCCAGGVVRSA
jgi:type I restriction enzyme S subunit